MNIVVDTNVLISAVLWNGSVLGKVKELEHFMDN